MYNQFSKYFDSLLAPNQCGFRKGFSSQYCLLVMLEKFKEAIDRGNQFGALLTDLSKAFDCIDHKLLIAKVYNTAFHHLEHTEPKLMTVLVLDQILNTVFQRAQFWVHYFLILI